VAHRVLIFLALKKLEKAFSVAYSIPRIARAGLDLRGESRVPRLHAGQGERLSLPAPGLRRGRAALYRQGHVPTLWDKKTKKIVNNESSEIIRMLNSEFKGIAGDDTDYYPIALRGESIASTTSSTHASITACIAAASPRSQQAYDQAYDALFGALDELEARLGRNSFWSRQGDRGRLAPLSDAGALRRGVLFDLPLQSPAHRRLSEPEPLTCAAVTRAGHRGDRQAALLRDRLLVGEEGQPERHHPERRARAPTSKKTGGERYEQMDRCTARLHCHGRRGAELSEPRGARGGRCSDRRSRPRGRASSRRSSRRSSASRSWWKTRPAPTASSAPPPWPRPRPTAYTLLVYSSGFVINPYVHKSCRTTRRRISCRDQPGHEWRPVFAVANSVPVNRLQEFLEYAKKPGVNLAYSTPGSATPGTWRWRCSA